MSQVRLIASDLDGTLLRADSTLSERSKDALRKAQDAGIKVVLVSGRHPRSLRAIAQDAGVQGLAVCSNGAIIYDPERNIILRHTALDQEMARQLIAELRRVIPGVAFALEVGPHFSWEAHFAPEREGAAKDVPICDDALDLCIEPITKLIVGHTDIPSDTLIEHARRIVGEDQATITYSMSNRIEISQVGVHKAAALEALCIEQGILREEVVAFGDMPNDLAMLQWAGHSVAVANAHPLILEAADEITRSNVEDGVAIVVERLLNGAKKEPV